MRHFVLPESGQPRYSTSLLNKVGGIMELAKKTADYSIFKKRNGRYGVKNSAGKWVNAADKAAILSKEGMIKLSPKKAAEPEASEE